MSAAPLDHDARPEKMATVCMSARLRPAVGMVSTLSASGRRGLASDFFTSLFYFSDFRESVGVFFVFVVPVDQRPGFMLSFCLLKLHSILLNGF